MKKILFLCLFLSFCNTHDIKNKNDLSSILLWLIKDQFNHELFKYNEDPLMRTTNSTWQFTPASTSNSTSKTKVILIHGWDYTERSSDLPSSFDKKIAQITSTWSNALDYYNRDISGSRTSFDFYTFTYRTSDSISKNGTRLAEKLNSVFTQNDKVIVIASSMGGLVTRYAMYDPKNTGDVIDFVVTLGTPHYGSPFASSAYQVSSSTLAEIISFLTNTDGGRGLSHTNNGNGQTTIPNAVNSDLDSLNANTSRDSRFYPYVGDLSSDCNAAKTSAIFVTGCSVLKTGSPAFPATDGIVPVNSAKMADKVSVSQITTKTGFDHLMLTFKVPNNASLSESFFTEVITKIKTF
ncbi:MAG: alpha/beta hydrolase [Leptospiraceae bacterium]|nr:alpha/beta hydrolase [Leptospiraceae bacterium]MCK6380664.1 alpha/beta hydrolase [Leptospiraceae bacterium]NUM41958.1 alpha/beta hydrolase [Leptospiraceae bacterium]